MEESDVLPLLISTSPESPEMDRDELGPQIHPKFESLSQKLLAHYKKGMGKSKPEVSASSSPPDCISRMAVPVFFFTVLSALKICLFDVMPGMYEGRNDIVLLQQCLICFIFAEVMINWLCIRYVGSSYQFYISLRGDPHLHKQALSQYRPKQQTPKDESSAAVLMPLIPQMETFKELAGRRCESLDIATNLHSGLENCVNAKSDLAEEAESVNQWMYRRNEQMNSKSIADLICVAEDEKSRSSSSLLGMQGETLPGIKQDVFDLMQPKPAIRRNGKTVTESYPYWSWVPCYACRRTRPPRCHHCPLCKMCVLKRDHHCFFAGTCIGYRNYRYFIIFLFWALIGSVYATLHGLPYIRLFIWSHMSFFDVFFPVAFVRFLLGYLSFHTVLSVTTLTALFVFNFVTAYYLFHQSRLISLGLTSFEKSFLKSSLEIQDTRRLSQKIRGVFGRCWLLNFVFPTHFFWEPEEDPIYWPDIRIFKH